MSFVHVSFLWSAHLMREITKKKKSNSQEMIDEDIEDMVNGLILQYGRYVMVPYLSDAICAGKIWPYCFVFLTCFAKVKSNLALGNKSHYYHKQYLVAYI